MMRSLFSGVSGLQNHQTRMDVIGNNIANINTTGFKRGRVNFQDMFYQQLQCAARPTDYHHIDQRSLRLKDLLPIRLPRRF